MSSFLRLHKDKKIETIEDFSDMLFYSKSYAHYTAKILQAIRDNTINETKLQEVAQKLDIPWSAFAYIIHSLKRKGIIEKRGKITFSSKFLYRITEIADFYSKFTGKTNPWQELINTYREILKTKGIDVDIKVLEEMKIEQ